MKGTHNLYWQVKSVTGLAGAHALRVMTLHSRQTKRIFDSQSAYKTVIWHLQDSQSAYTTVI